METYPTRLRASVILVNAARLAGKIPPSNPIKIEKTIAVIRG